MKVFITGHTGQLGSALMGLFAEAAGFGHPEGDITQAEAVRSAVMQARPDVVIHCAAMTDVDGAARNPALAYRVNALGTQYVAEAAEAAGAALMYISSNEVFDGTARRPYREFDAANPINPYGYSKWAGECLAQRVCRRVYVVRTAWVTSAGGRNFVHRIRQLADERGALRVVQDEVANPTFVADLAPALARLAHTERFGVYHLTNSGFCSRFDYAQKVLALSGRGQVPLTPITLADFRRDSTPPPFAPLANLAAAALGIELPPWEEALARFLQAERQASAGSGT